MRRLRLPVGEIVVTAVLVIAAAGRPPAAQAPAQPTPAQQTPTFKVEVNYVEVDALVVDRDGNFVRDLKKDDFQVLEDGKPQAISAFSLVDIPIERAQRPLYAARPIEPDVRTNERPFDGRVYVMVIDDLHTAPTRTQRVKAAAKQFIEQRFGANDLMAVVHTRGGSGSAQEFTGNKQLLLAAVDHTIGNALQSATLNRTEYYNNTRGMLNSGDPITDIDDQERAYNARSTLDTLKNVADWFGNVHGRRKAILFMSEGIDYNIYNLFGYEPGSVPGGAGSQGAMAGNAQAIIDETRDVIAAATRSNVSIYGIDPRGLTSLGDDDITVQAYPDDPTLGIGAGSLHDELLLQQDSLRELSDETGGFAVVNRNDFGTAFDRIVKDNSSYYVLAYYPQNEKRDGKFHKIDVRVDRPGLTVRARRGYASPKGKAPTPTKATANASAELHDALNSPLPVSGLTMAVSATPFKGSAPNASVLFTAELRGKDLQLGPNDKVELSYLAIDQNGKIRGGNSDTLTLNLRPETRARIQQSGVRMLNRVDLPPGRYQVRFAAHDTSGGALGSVLYDLEVPEFSKAPFSMSGIVLTSASGSEMPTARPDEQMKQVLPGPPIALRDFPQNDEIALFVEVYDNDANKPHKVDVTTTITADDGRVLFKTDEERSSTEIQGKRGGYGITTRIPLKDVPPGNYVLKVEAHSRLGNQIAAAREIPITVSPVR